MSKQLLGYEIFDFFGFFVEDENASQIIQEHVSHFLKELTRRISLLTFKNHSPSRTFL